MIDTSCSPGCIKTRLPSMYIRSAQLTQYHVILTVSDSIFSFHQVSGVCLFCLQVDSTRCLLCIYSACRYTPLGVAMCVYSACRQTDMLCCFNVQICMTELVIQLQNIMQQFERHTLQIYKSKLVNPTMWYSQ